MGGGAEGGARFAHPSMMSARSGVREGCQLIVYAIISPAATHPYAANQRRRPSFSCTHS